MQRYEGVVKCPVGLVDDRAGPGGRSVGGGIADGRKGASVEVSYWWVVGCASGEGDCGRLGGSGTGGGVGYDEPYCGSVHESRISTMACIILSANF